VLASGVASRANGRASPVHEEDGSVVMQLDQRDVRAVLGWSWLIPAMETTLAALSVGRVIQPELRHGAHGPRRHPGAALEGGVIPSGVAGGT
jgi:hypothetical protein